jgi:hypothetical protein
MACRVVKVSGNDVTIDQLLSIQPNGYSVRLDDGTVRTGSITGNVSIDTFTLDNVSGINPDDIIVLGEVNRVVGKYIVQAINPGANLTAELQMVKYVPEVYRSDTEAIPPWNPEMSQDMINSTTLAVDKLNITQTLTYNDRLPFAELKLDWTLFGYGYAKGEVYMTEPNKPPVLLGATDSTTYTYLVDLLKRPDLVGSNIKFEIVPLTASGVPGKSGTATINVKGDTEKPKPVLGFAVNIQSETVNCMWARPPEPDVVEYQLRYSPDVTPSAYWDGAQHLATVPWTSTQVAAGARTGTYMIRAYDSSGNASDVVMQRTTVEKLPNIEQVTDIDDRLLGWGGQKTNLTTRLVQKDRMMSEWNKLSQVAALDEKGAGIGDLISDGAWGSVAPESFYTFKDVVDLTDIYEVRVASMIEVHGEDRYGNTTSADLWDAWLEYRSIGQKEFISDWVTLAAQPDMIGTGGTWSEWRRIAVGDVTGKLLQFRIQIRSFDPNVKVVVTDGSVIIDAIDRTWYKEDFVIGARTTRVNFDPPFMFDEVAVAINIEGSNKYLVSKVTNKTRTGFDIELMEAETKALTAGKVDIIARGQGRERTKSI